MNDDAVKRLYYTYANDDNIYYSNDCAFTRQSLTKNCCWSCAIHVEVKLHNQTQSRDYQEQDRVR